MSNPKYDPVTLEVLLRSDIEHLKGLLRKAEADLVTETEVANAYQWESEQHKKVLKMIHEKAEYLILQTPTGMNRDILTDINILALNAIS